MQKLTRSVLVALLACVVTAGVGLAGTQATSNLKAEILEVDAEAHTITFQTYEDQENVLRATLPLESEAVDAMDWLQSGDMVTLTCRHSEDGKLLAVTDIVKG